jgi:hypothetical protein
LRLVLLLRAFPLESAQNRLSLARTGAKLAQIGSQFTRKRTHAASCASLNVPAATPSIMATDSSGSRSLAPQRRPLRSTNLTSARKAARLLPSGSGWLRDPGAEHGGLVDEVGVDLGAAVRRCRSREGRLGQTEVR